MTSKDYCFIRRAMSTQNRLKHPIVVSGDCRPPFMNQAVQQMGEDFGIPDEHIRFDDFGG